MGNLNQFTKPEETSSNRLGGTVDLAVANIEKGLNVTQVLIDAYEDLKGIDALHFSFADIKSLSDAFDCIMPAIQAIREESKKKDTGLYKLGSLVGGQIKDTKVGKTLDSIAPVTNELLQLSDGRVVAAINPTALLVAGVLVTVKEETAKIVDACNQILTFLKNDKESQVEGDLNVLNGIVKEYKYNWDNKEYRAGHHKLVLDIKRSAEQNIVFFRKQIDSSIQNDKHALVAKTLKERQQELENEFSYYQLTLYIYGFACFLDVLLLGNFNKEFLAQTNEKLALYSSQYLELFETALEHLKKTVNTSTESKALHGVGGLLLKAKAGSWLNKKGEAIVNASIKQSLDSFLLLKEDKALVFSENIKRADEIFNDCTEICFGEDGVYFVKPSKA